MFKILNESEIDYSEWRDFVSLNKDGSVFHTPEITDVFNTEKNYKSFAFFAVDGKNKIYALMTGFIQNVKGGVLKTISTRAVLMQTPIYNNTEALEYLLNYYKDYMKNKAVYTEIRNHSLSENKERLIYEENGFKFENHLNILVSLNKSEEELWKSIKRSRKDGINKAKKVNFIFQVSDKCNSIDIFYKLLEELYQKIKLPIPGIDFYKKLDKQEKTIWFSLSYENEPIIILCALSYKKRLFVYTIGIKQDEEITRMRPVDYFYWKVLDWANANDFTIYDWMGAGKPDKEYGVRKFKMQYGGDLLDLGRYIYIHSKFNFWLANKGFSLMQKTLRKV